MLVNDVGDVVDRRTRCGGNQNQNLQIGVVLGGQRSRDVSEVRLRRVDDDRGDDTGGARGVGPRLHDGRRLLVAVGSTGALDRGTDPRCASTKTRHAGVIARRIGCGG
jgi:hypothetical protein